MNRKSWFVTVLSIIGFLLLSAGFAFSGGTSETSSKGVTLNTIVFNGWARTAALQKQIIEYQNETGVKVNIETVPFQQLHQKLILDFASKTGNYDFFGLLTDWEPEFVHGDFLVPLESYIQQDPPQQWPNAFPENLIKYLTLNGKLYALPCHDGPELLYYRKDLLDDPANQAAFKAKYGYDLAPPRTWQQFLDIARFFNAPDRGFYGTVLGSKQGGQQLTYDFLLMLWTYGGHVFDDNMHPIFNSEAGAQGLQFYADLRNKWGVTPKASTTYDESENGPFYLDGHAAMMWNWSHIGGWAEMPEHSKIIGKNGIALIPTGDPSIPQATLDSYWGWAISNFSKHKDATYKLINWLSNVKNDKLDARMGTIATRLSTLRDPEMLKEFPVYGFIDKALENFHTVPRIPEYAQIDDIIGSAASKVIAQESTAKQALDQAAAQVNALMIKDGYYSK